MKMTRFSHFATLGLVLSTVVLGCSSEGGSDTPADTDDSSVANGADGTSANPSAEDGAAEGDDATASTGDTGAATTTCANGVQDNGEQGIDCGGPCVVQCVSDGDGGLVPDPDSGFIIDVDSGMVIPVDSGVPEVDSGVTPPEPTPHDGIKNGDETDVDCGGTKAPVCAVGNTCLAGTDCADKACIGGVCTAPSPTDGVKNGDETDVDCGGAESAKCGIFQTCNDASNCSSNVCVGNQCQGASPTDGVKNGDESDIDCGGTAAPTCGAGKACGAATDCADKVCTGSKCQAASPSDGVQNADETDIDCGGVASPKCGTSKTCLIAANCSSSVCTGGFCIAPSSSDGVKNGSETDIDCGGASAPKCGTGKTCGAPGDCTSAVCTGGTCRSASSSDGVKNGSETDIDCGGGAAPLCATGKVCIVAGDCATGICTGNVCKASSSTDGVKNGTETDVDCGGASAPKCANDLGCLANSDCTSNICGTTGAYKNKCLVAPSCTGGTGASNTCGANKDQSCCSTIQIPSVKNAGNVTMAAYKLDTYEVTAGRYRAYLNAVGGNPRANAPAAGAGAHPTWTNTGWRSSWNIRLASGWSDVNFRLGANGCKRGGSGEYGTTTWNATAGAKDAEGVEFDSKPIDCIDWYSLLAFCIWDGGRLPTVAEFRTAWNGGSTAKAYPWGTTPAVSSPNYPFNPSPQVADYAVIGNYGGGTINGTFYPQFYTWGTSYRYSNDRATHIAPPGSKPLGAGPYGHMDLAGNLMEWLFDNYSTSVKWGQPDTNFPDPNTDVNLPWSQGDWGEWTGKKPSTGTSTVWMDAGGNRTAGGGSWEGHQIPNGGSYLNEWPGGVMGTYHALGGRCARN